MRQSNTTLERLMLIEHWKNPVIVLCKDEKPIVNGIIEMYLTTDSVNKRLAEIPDKTSYSYSKVPSIIAVNAVLQGECEGLLIGGLASEDLYISKKDLSVIEEQVDTIVMLMSVSSNVLDRKSAFKNLRKKTCFILGTLPELFAKAGGDETFETVSRNNYSSAKVFLSRESASRYNANNIEINEYPFVQVATALQSGYGIIVEPHEDYWVEFLQEELIEYLNM